MYGYQGCQYPNICYGPPVIDMGASMANPDGPWVTQPSLAGFGLDHREAGSAGLGILLGMGAILALVVAIASADARGR